MIADRIRLARRKAGLSLRDLAAAMDHKVTAQAIGKYERGEDIPSSGVLMSLAEALGVSVSYLMDTQGLVLSGVEFRTKANTTATDRAGVCLLYTSDPLRLRRDRFRNLLRLGCEAIGEPK